MTRLEFLQHSGLLAAGLTVLPHSVWAAAAQSPQAQPISARKLAAYQIVLPASPTPVEQQAAERLQHYLSQITQNSPVILSEAEYHNGPAIFLGQTRYAQSRKVDVKPLQQDGFALHPAGKNLIIAGGAGKGVLYGVYGLLDLSGFRMYTSQAIQVPARAQLLFPRKPLIVVPQIQYRTTSYRDTSNPEYTNWHALSSRSEWGLFVHTFNELVSPDQYGKSHPEYFSLINGVRLPGTQLCLSNPEVLAVLNTNLKARMAARPGASYWSVSQNDNDQYCHCGPCTDLNTKYGGVPSGSILYFVNDVARAFPDKTISTLAYWYSRTPPQNITAQPNVNIMLCNIESRRQGPVYETDPAFSRDLVNWGKLSGNILIWDYNIQFSNLVSPFPNLHTLKPNIKFYTDHHVNSLFMQANGQAGGEFAGLRAYLITELMWNPEADDNALMNDYLAGYFGPAGPIIRQYIDKMRESLLATGFKLNIFGSPEDAKDAYLSPAMMQVYNGIFDQAEKSVANNPQLLQRVKIARLPILYATIQIGRNEVDTPRSMFAHTAGGKVFVKPEMKTLVDEFVAGCKADGVTRVRERTTSPDDYLASYHRLFTRMDEMQRSPALGKAITAVTLPTGGAAKAQQLTSGIFGSWESWSAPDVHWVDWKGQHMDIVLDLGQLTPIRSVEMDFLNPQAQPDWNLFALPKFVTYATSTDGQAYSDPIRIDNPNNPDPKVNPGIANIPVFPFRADLAAPTQARYIRVHAESLLQAPKWHIRAGQPMSLFTDQIMVL